MATEMVCGNCQGRLLVEQTGVIVACPHCGAHLQIGDVPTPPQPPPQPQMYYQPQNYSQPQYPPNYPPQNYPPQNYPPQNYPQPNYQQPNPQFYAPTQAPEPTWTPPPEQKAPLLQELSPQSNVPSQPSVTPPAPQLELFKPPAASEKAPEPLLFQMPPEVPASSNHPPASFDLFTAPSTSIPESVEPAPTSPSPESATKSSASEAESWMPKIDTSMPPAINTNPAESAEPTDQTSDAVAKRETDAVPSPATTDVNPPMMKFEAAPATAVIETPPPTEIWKSASVPVVPPSTPDSNPVPRESAPNMDFSGFGSPAATATPTAAGPNQEFNVSHVGMAQGESEESTLAPDMGSGIQLRDDNRSAPGVSTQLFVVVASYASAMTLAFLYIWLKTQNGSPLDLPDRKPVIYKGRVGVSIYPDGPLPGTHRLKLGESKQYGSLKVTPVKVTRGPLEFEHHSGNPQMKKIPSFSPVLKLWVKFENVSSDQVFPALDEDLVYTKINDRSNNYLCLEQDRVPKGKKIGIYDWPTNSEWLMKGQKLDTNLNPGDTWETYIPTNDERDLETLQGPLAWRMQFRKGYNRSTFRGVTTIVEVEFDSKDIQADS